MATPTLKKETISITLEKGSGTILVSRPGSSNPNNTVGLIHQFTYTGNATMALMEALAAARRKLDEQIAATAAKPASPATKPATSNDKPTDEDDQTDANEDTEPTDEDDQAATSDDAEPTDDQADDEPTDDDPASAPPNLEPVTDDDQADAGNDFQTLLLF